MDLVSCSSIDMLIHVNITVHSIKYIYFYNSNKKAKIVISNEAGYTTIPGPTVHGPPTRAMIRAPVPATHAPNKPAATVRATPVQRKARLLVSTGQRSNWSSSSNWNKKKFEGKT